MRTTLFLSGRAPLDALLYLRLSWASATQRSRRLRPMTGAGDAQSPTMSRGQAIGLQTRALWSCFSRQARLAEPDVRVAQHARLVPVSKDAWRSDWGPTHAVPPIPKRRDAGWFHVKQRRARRGASRAARHTALPRPEGGVDVEGGRVGRPDGLQARAINSYHLSIAVQDFCSTSGMCRHTTSVHRSHECMPWLCAESVQRRSVAPRAIRSSWARRSHRVLAGRLGDRTRWAKPRHSRFGLFNSLAQVRSAAKSSAVAATAALRW
jgi:hypothetical protein